MFKSRFKAVLSVMLASAILFSFCGCGSKATIESLQDEIDELEDENKKLKKENESLQDEVDDLKAQLGEEPVPTDTDIPITKTSGDNKVGISMPTKDLQRWNQDGDMMKTQLEAAGYEVDLQYASNKVETQVSQVEDMINSGCNVLVIAPIESSSLGTVLDEAKEKNITVISYDRLIMNTDAVDYYVSFDNYMVGQIQGQYIKDALDLDNAAGPFNIEFTTGDPGDNNALFFYNGAMDVLKPYIDTGKLVVVSGQIDFESVATAEWSTATSQARAENILASYYMDGTYIDAWLCSNDSTAQGVVNALDSYYSGSYPIITGQDCDIISVKNILTGKQSMSVFKDTRTLVYQTVKMVDQIFSGETVDVNDESTYDNGNKLVHSYLCAPVFVDINNYKEILIDSGYYTESDLDI